MCCFELILEELRDFVPQIQAILHCLHADSLGNILEHIGAWLEVLCRTPLHVELS